MAGLGRAHNDLSDLQQVTQLQQVLADLEVGVELIDLTL